MVHMAGGTAVREEQPHSGADSAAAAAAAAAAAQEEERELEVVELRGDDGTAREELLPATAAEEAGQEKVSRRAVSFDEDQGAAGAAGRAELSVQTGSFFKSRRGKLMATLAVESMTQQWNQRQLLAEQHNKKMALVAEIFATVDVDGSGTLGREEFAQM
eukprot:COSAG02_NODE_352_length_24036_cov_20.479258_29_plen_160_part_00